MKKEIRAFVCATAHLPIPGLLYRGLYHLMAGLCRLYARISPGVVALHFRGSYARGDFQPGISDLDVLVVVDSELKDENAFRLSGRLRRHYRIAKRLVPFLGELEILESETAAAWFQFAEDRFDFRPAPHLPANEVEAVSELERVRKALSDFIYLWQPSLNRWGERELQRLSHKIGKKIPSSPEPQTPTIRPSDRWTETLRLLALFAEVPHEAQAGELRSPVKNLQQLDELPEPLCKHHELVLSFARSPFDFKDCIVVLRDEYTCEKACAELLKDLYHSALRPKILNPSSLKIYLQCISPLHALSLARDIHIWGDRKPWTDLNLGGQAFDFGVRCEAATALPLPYSEELDLSNLEFLLLGRLLRLKRLLSDGVGEVYFHEILEHYQRTEPDFYEQLSTLLDTPTPLSAFRMVRRLSKDLACLLVVRHDEGCAW